MYILFYVPYPLEGSGSDFIEKLCVYGVAATFPLEFQHQENGKPEEATRNIV